MSGNKQGAAAWKPPLLERCVAGITDAGYKDRATDIVAGIGDAGIQQPTHRVSCEVRTRLPARP